MPKCGFSRRLLSWSGVLAVVGCAHGVELGLVDDAEEGGISGSGGGASTGSEGGASGASVGPTGAGGEGGTGGAGGAGGIDAGSGSAAGGASGGGGVAGSSAGVGGSGGRDAGAAGARLDASAGSAGAAGKAGASGAAGAAGAAGAVVDAQSDSPSGCPTCSLKVQYQCFQDGGMVHQIEFGVSISNPTDAAIPLNTVSMRYWYTADATGTQQPRCDSALLGCTAISLGAHAATLPKPSADSYIELGFTSTAMLAPHTETSEIRVSILKTNSSAYNQANDYSFKSTGAIYVDAPSVTAYVAGRLAWGAEP